MLLVKTDILKDDQYNRLLLLFTLNADKELTRTPEDPLQYLTLSNVVSSPSLMADGTPWRGSREILDVLYQVIIEMCSKPRQLVADLSRSTGASFKACKASDRHYFGMEGDKQIFTKLLKPLCCPPRALPFLLVDARLSHGIQTALVNSSSNFLL